MKPYILRQTKLTRERIETKLEQSLLNRLERYCVYLESDRDYVISQALAIAFDKDSGFREWCRLHPASANLEDAADKADSATQRGRSV